MPIAILVSKSLGTWFLSVFLNLFMIHCRLVESSFSMKVFSIKSQVFVGLQPLFLQTQ